MTANSPSRRPNILQIICHDMGRHLGTYGRPIQTPEIDRLAREGVRFDQYFVSAPQCSPSRASLISGRYPHRTGVMGLVNHGGWRLADDCPTLAKSLAAAGYGTWLWGFQHEHEDPARLGYQHDPIGYQRGQVPKILAGHVTPRLCDWLAGRPQGPWFASVGLYEPHLPWPKQEHRPNGSSVAEVPAYLPDGPQLRQDMCELAASVHRVDRAVGRILDTLDAAALADDTLVIFTTDHGLPLPRAKCTLYDPGLEAALLMRWPEALAANRECSELLSGVDLMPTLLDLAGVEIPRDIDGHSFAPLLRGGHYPPRQAIFAEQTWHDAYCPLRAIRTHRFKLIRRFHDVPANLLPKDFYHCCVAAEVIRRHFDHMPPRWEAYDLACDPHEQRNLIHEAPTDHPTLGPLSAQLEQWMHDTDDPLRLGPVELPDPSTMPA